MKEFLILVAAACVIAVIFAAVFLPWFDAHHDLACWTVQTTAGEKQICGMVTK